MRTESPDLLHDEAATNRGNKLIVGLTKLAVVTANWQLDDLARTGKNRALPADGEWLPCDVQEADYALAALLALYRGAPVSARVFQNKPGEAITVNTFKNRLLGSEHPKETHGNILPAFWGLDVLRRGLPIAQTRRATALVQAVSQSGDPWVQLAIGEPVRQELPVVHN